MKNEYWKEDLIDRVLHVLELVFLIGAIICSIALIAVCIMKIIILI